MASNMPDPVRPRPAVARATTPPDQAHGSRHAFLDALGAYVEWRPVDGEQPVDGLVLQAGESPDRLCGRVAALLERSPGAVVAPTAELSDPLLRHHFLVRLFAVARLREVGRTRSISGLVRFHSDYKLVLMAQSPSGQYRLGRIVANADRLPFERRFESYQAELTALMQEPARRPRVVNALQHAFGYLSERLRESEKRDFLERLERYPRGEIPLAALLDPLRAWIHRHEVEYLARQAIFDPYPAGLARWTGAASGPL